ncbi:HET-domain-containing protein, partial [Clathrospora elynae]
MNSTDAKAHIGRVTKPDNIDWDHVKSWISFCSQDAHQNSRQLSIDLADGNRKSYPELRVIDVKTACIVQLPLSAGYVALSYQWGMDQRLKLRMNNKTQLETPGFFEAADCQPSRTIVDAMEVVERLGYRYLWVDALCIIQDSAKDLLLNVNKMDRIYRDAELTIVGAAGNDAEHGLPGVSVSRTEQQIRIAIDGITAANMLEPAAGAITFSRWNTRGWTYQERILSRKLLTFTNSQVFYHC